MAYLTATSLGLVGWLVCFLSCWFFFPPLILSGAVKTSSKLSPDCATQLQINEVTVYILKGLVQFKTSQGKKQRKKQKDMFTL